MNDPKADLLAVAAASARDSEALCADVAAMIFPTASIPPSEETLAHVSTKLVNLVRSIEQRLKPDTADASIPHSWQLLARSGFLREPELIDFVLARVAEDRLETKIAASRDEAIDGYLPAQLLDHADANVADAAQCLLAADSLHRKTGEQAFRELRPELLHQLCWRIVAVLEVSSGAKDEQVIQSAKTLLSEYDENGTSRTAARKLAHFLDDEMGAKLLDPLHAGLHLFVATVAARMRLDHDHVLRLIDTPSATSLSVLLRGCAIGRDEAMAIIYLAKGFNLTPRDVATFDRLQTEMSVDEAQAETARWAVARSQQLLGRAGA